MQRIGKKKMTLTDKYGKKLKDKITEKEWSNPFKKDFIRKRIWNHPLKGKFEPKTKHQNTKIRKFKQIYRDTLIISTIIFFWGMWHLWTNKSDFHTSPSTVRL